MIPENQPKRGRPSAYTSEIAETICERLMDGESLRAICASAGMPDKATVFRWIACTGGRASFRRRTYWPMSLRSLTAKPMIVSKRSARVVERPWTWVARSSIAVASGSIRGFGHHAPNALTENVPFRCPRSAQ